MNESKRQQRQSNIELYRIILMILIVAHHYFVNSGLSEAVLETPSLYTYLYEVLGMWGKTGINCFVLITGYFMIKSKTTPMKFLKLFAEIMFYKIVIYAIFLLTGYTSLSFKGFVKNIFPIKDIAQGFTSCYLLFYLLIPFINVLLHNISKQQHQRLLAVLLFAYTIIGSIPKFGIVMNYISWFTVVYIIGAYLRLYPEDFEKHRKGILFSISVLLAILSVVGMTWIAIHRGVDKTYFFVSDSNKIFAVFVSITMFLFFKDLKIKQSKAINTIAASTFGVFCIHANSDLMRQWLWKDTLNNVAAYKVGGYTA